MWPTVTTSRYAAFAPPYRKRNPVADVALLVIHHLPDDPPTGNIDRAILLGWDDGIVLRAQANAHNGVWRVMPVWWSELPALPADPSERLTTGDVRTVCNMAEYLTRNVPTDDPDGMQVGVLAIARLRATLPGEEEVPERE